ncbi:MAG: hypothetical protein RLZZ241_1567 [Bacteroidota bacterium]|jgi:5-formyltetrahydrofolate cyclo-ligase
MDKNTVRSIFLKRRGTLDSVSLSALSTQLFQQLLKLPIWDFKTFHVFISITHKKEVDTAPIIEHLHRLNKQIVVPKILEKGELNHFLLAPDSKMVPNKWGVLEPLSGVVVAPASLDVIFVPLLAFDLNGNRVGYGGGYYDKFLGACSAETITVGLSLFEPVNEISGLYPGDIPLKYAVTPKDIFQF